MELNALINVGNFVSKFSLFLGNELIKQEPSSFIIINLLEYYFHINFEEDDLLNIFKSIENDKSSADKFKQIEEKIAKFIVSEKMENDVMDTMNNVQNDGKDVVSKLSSRDLVLDFIAFLVIFGYFLMCYLIVFNKLDSENSQVLLLMFGQLTGGFIMILNHYFKGN